MSDHNSIISHFRDAICQCLDIPDNELNSSDNLFELGLDSMFLMRIVNQCRRAGCKITLKDIYQHPTLADIQNLVISKMASTASHAAPQAPNYQTMTQGTPFAMTPVQLAYYVGRDQHQPLGGNGCHLYQEFNTQNLDPNALESAINTLIHRHPMLSVAFNHDGTQQWKKPQAVHPITRHDLTQLSSNDAEQAMLTLRNKLSHRVLDVNQGQTIDVQVSLLNQQQCRIHVSIDLLVMDASSFSLFFNELSALLKGQTLPSRPTDYDFLSYLQQENHELREQRHTAEAFWQSQLSSLPAAPNLPLVQEPAQQKKPSFQRRQHSLDKHQWQTFQALASAHQVTPTMVLATLYAAVMARWSGQSKLLLNLTLFDCHPFNDAVNGMLADFTNILLIDTHIDDANITDLIQAHQRRFAELYEHRITSGVEVLRSLKKNGTHPHGAPVVFTSNLGNSLFGDEIEGPLGQPGWGISQTPQVWLDFVAFKQGDGIVLQWDGIDELFPEGFIDTLFAAFTQLVEHILTQPQAWCQPLPDLLPHDQKSTRLKRNLPVGNIPSGLLHQRIFDYAQGNPDQMALISQERTLSYGQLTAKARQLAQVLIDEGLSQGEHVAISMEKSVGQVVAALAILYAGGVYVPIAPNQPIARRQSIVDSADIRLVIRCQTAQLDKEWTQSIHINWQEAQGSELTAIETQRQPSDTAYIIYTSGSTGTPKGVVISHQAALNTCIDINQRHQVGQQDRVLALSALHFDLSVYDMFGVLAAGGALVLPKETQLRDPMAWSELVSRHHITLWNTVPALFDMFLTFCEGMALTAPSQLRTVMLSGDWIDLSLPQRYRSFSPRGTFSAMGGATEAAIWSNEYLVDNVDPSWRSIPYGYPLTNQCYRVVDESGQDCPDWVQGELWIGGVGVAQGYWNDPQKTCAQFIKTQCPDSGDLQSWYRTGDTGCYWPDGTIEFLGRKDNQVKIGGYRIELGEIDAALGRLEGVHQGVTLALNPSGSKDKQLEGFVVTQGMTLCTKVKPEPTLPANYQDLFAAVSLSSPSCSQADIAAFLYHHLTDYLPDSGTAETLQQWQYRYGVNDHYRRLFEQWMQLLCAKDLAQKVEPASPSLNTQTYQLIDNPPAVPRGFGTQAEIDQASRQLNLIITGNAPAHSLLETTLSPEAMVLANPKTHNQITQCVSALSALSNQLGRAVNVVECESRSGRLAELLATLLGPEKLNYHALDSSLAMVQNATARLNRLSHAQSQLYPAHSADFTDGFADVLLLNNALHRQQNTVDYLNQIIPLLAPEGLLLILEINTLDEGALLSAQVLETAPPQVLTAPAMQDLFDQTQLQLEHTDSTTFTNLYVLRNDNPVVKPDANTLIAQLNHQLPSYMVPKRFTFMPALPLTPNGKVDRQALSRLNLEAPQASQTIKPLESEQEHALAAVWQALFNQLELDRNSDFFLLGGDSLMATRCIGALSKAGYQADLTDLFIKTTLAEFAATLTPQDIDTQPSLLALSPKPDDRYLPFPMTDVQQAYWIGRQRGFALGETSAQFFLEFRVPHLDLSRFNRAMNRLIERHDMLRAVVRNHQQQVLIQVPAFSLRCHPVEQLDCPEADAIRDRLSHQVNDPAFWPLFTIEAAIHVSGEARLFVGLDNMMLDGLSMQIFLSELETLYHHPMASLPELTLTFRDYVAWRQAPENTLGTSPAKAYWLSQLPTLPSAPDLPIQSDPATLKDPKFIRCATTLSIDEWQSLKTMAARHQVTPSVILMCAYAATLSSWSQSESLTLNLTLFDRPDVHPQLNQVLGDFTTLLLLAWHPETSWLSSLKRLQAQLANDLQHSDVSAVWVMRELARQNNEASTTMPVVFTSALGTSDSDFLSDSGWLKPVWGISQTPQIWLDHQVYESSGQLCLNWDAVEALLPQPLLEQMFSQYVDLLKTLASKPECWSMGFDQLSQGDPSYSRYINDSTTPSDQISEDVACHDPANVRQIQDAFKHIVTATIGEKQNFFDAGASSLQLVQLHAALHQQGMGISVTDLFTYPSPSLLAASLSQQSTSSTPSPEALSRQLRQENRKMNRRQRAK
ncbi:amino acid adenylation domain-containing protein [Vibrio ostreicida]|uniref:amino acid adenylation domain-containing protein n=1 Tax=Vibrio ostreicida TaxID=526588 RepID=UPI003B5CE9A6